MTGYYPTKRPRVNLNVYLSIDLTNRTYRTYRTYYSFRTWTNRKKQSEIMVRGTSDGAGGCRVRVFKCE